MAEHPFQPMSAGGGSGGGGTGDISQGPGNAIGDNEVIRGDSVADSIQGSGATLDDSNNLDLTTGKLSSANFPAISVSGNVASFNGVGGNTIQDSGVAAASVVVGAASVTDNALARYDGTTGKLLQDGILTSADINGDLAGPTDKTTTTAAGSAFTNQPNNDGVEVISNNAGDTQTATIIGTTTGTDTVVVEDIVLQGLTETPTVKTNWGVILAVKLSSAAVGTITFREASGNATITTITAGNTQKGVNLVAAADQSAWNRLIEIVANNTTTKQVGLQGTNSVGATIYDSQALTSTTIALSNTAFTTVTEIYTGDVESNRTVTITSRGGVAFTNDVRVTEQLFGKDGTTASPSFSFESFPLSGLSCPGGNVTLLRSGASVTLTNGTAALAATNEITADATLSRPRLKIQPKTTTPISVHATNDCFTVFTNEGAGAPITFNLPSAVAGQNYTFIVQAAQNMVVTAAGGDTIRIAAGVSSAGGTATNGTVGGYLQLTAINGTEFVAGAVQGTWTLA